jgi:hypothetical protein
MAMVYKRMKFLHQTAALDDLQHLIRWVYRRDYQATVHDGDTFEAFLHQRTVLLTWIGERGVIPSEGYEHLLTKPDALASKLKTDQTCIAFFADLKALAEKLKKEFHLAAVSYALEMCTLTLAEKGTIRVHTHMFLEAGFKKKIHIRNVEVLMFDGMVPHRGLAKADGTSGNVMSKQPACGHYYLRMPKHGSVLSDGSHRPYLDYRVNPEWIMSYMQQGKLAAHYAYKEICKTWKNAEMHTKALKFVTGAFRDLAAEEEDQLIWDAEQEQLGKLAHFPELDAWLDHMKHRQARHKVLVLDGPSQTGKTTACKCLAIDREKYYEINCANLMHEPNLRNVSDAHRLINFDELRASTFISNKKIFQGAMGRTTLGENTAGGSQAYSQRLNGIMMVICSNHWARDVLALHGDDQDYIRKNVFLVQLKPGQTMWSSQLID